MSRLMSSSYRGFLRLFEDFIRFEEGDRVSRFGLLQPLLRDGEAERRDLSFERLRLEVLSTFLDTCGSTTCLSFDLIAFLFCFDNGVSVVLKTV